MKMKIINNKNQNFKKLGCLLIQKKMFMLENEVE